MKANARKINNIEVGSKYSHAMTGTEGTVEGVFAGRHTEDLLLRYPSGGRMATDYFPLKECKPVVKADKVVKPKTVKKHVVKKATPKVVVKK